MFQKIQKTLRDAKQNLRDNREYESRNSTADRLYKAVMHSRKLKLSSQETARLHEIADLARDLLVYELTLREKLLVFLLMAAAVEVVFAGSVLAVVAFVPGLDRITAPDWAIVAIMIVWALAIVAISMYLTCRPADGIIDRLGIAKGERRERKLDEFLRDTESVHARATAPTVRNYSMNF